MRMNVDQGPAHEADVQLEILAALVQVTNQPTVAQKVHDQRSSSIYTEDYNASQKLMTAGDEECEKLSSDEEKEEGALMNMMIDVNRTLSSSDQNFQGLSQRF